MLRSLQKLRLEKPIVFKPGVTFGNKLVFRNLFSQKYPNF
jgi:hypothetical protein